MALSQRKGFIHPIDPEKVAELADDASALAFKLLQMSEKFDR